MCIGVPLAVLWLFAFTLDPGTVGIFTAAAAGLYLLVQAILDRIG